MKRIITLVLISISIISKAQEVTVKKSISGIQTGFLGLWIHNEFKLTNRSSLRSELGFDSGIWGGEFYDKTGFLFTPVLTLEPRFYYNMSKRNSKFKDVTNNSGNFISVKTSYHPDWFVISNYKNIHIVSDISIIPTWGLRRNIGNHLNYEVGIGLGYRYIFAKNAGYLSNSSEGALNLHLRFGYSF